MQTQKQKKQTTNPTPHQNIKHKIKITRNSSKKKAKIVKNFSKKKISQKIRGKKSPNPNRKSKEKWVKKNNIGDEVMEA